MSYPTLKTFLIPSLILMLIATGCASPVEQAQTQAAETLQAAADVATQNSASTQTQVANDADSTTVAQINADTGTQVAAFLGTGTPTVTGGPTQTGTPELESASGGKLNFNITGSPTYQASPTLPFTPTYTMTPPVANAWDWNAFKSWLNEENYVDPYVLIEALDDNPLKVFQWNGNWMTDEDSIVWSTMEDTQTNATCILCDGLTGLFFVPADTLVLSPAGQIRVSNFSGNVPHIDAVLDDTMHEVVANSCEQASVVAEAFATATSRENLVTKLDEIVDANPNARLASNTPGYVENLAAHTALFWTSGAATNASVVTYTGSGKIIWVTLGDKTAIDHAFSGVMLCDPITVEQMMMPDFVAENMSCVPMLEMAATITDNRGSLATRETTLYPAMQALAEKYPNAIITGTGGNVTVKWLTSVLMVENGATGDVIALDTQEHHSLWLAVTDGIANVAQAKYTHFKTCSDMKPERDLSKWWGQ